jgi:histidinol-phosphate/aromatic aminotransferase/cobyric acid decarboxylase-like protein
MNPMNVRQSSSDDRQKGPPPHAREALARLKPYSPGKPIWEVQREHGLNSVVKLASNENPLGPSPLALEAIARHAAELHRYPDADFGELRRALAGLPAGVLPVIDAAYGHFAAADDYSDGLDLIREGRTAVMLQTFSKIYGLAGIRIGYAVSQPGIIETLLRVKEPFNVNMLAQTAAIAALDDDEHVGRTRRMNAEGRAYLAKRCGELGLACTPSQSNFVLVRLGPKAKELYEGLLRSGVIVRYAGIWGLPEHVRISIGTPEENERLLEALHALLMGARA